MISTSSSRHRQLRHQISPSTCLTQGRQAKGADMKTQTIGKNIDHAMLKKKNTTKPFVHCVIVYCFVLSFAVLQKIKAN